MSIRQHNRELLRLTQAKHEDVKYSCNHCEYQATTQGSLKSHKQAIHKGVRYSCIKCEYQATQQGNIKRHKQIVHEGVVYSCTRQQHRQILRLANNVNTIVLDIHVTSVISGNTTEIS